MKRRFPAIVLCILLICSIFIPISLGDNVKNTPYQPVSSNRGNTLYVGGSGPDNYTKIQDAIDDADDGYTIYVFSGTYDGNLSVNKSINLIGENKNTTVINGLVDGYNGIDIYSDYVNISNFKFKKFKGGTGSAIFFHKKGNCVITNNIFDDNSWGLRIRQSHYNDISKNIFISQYVGIYLEHGSNYNNIYGNNMNENRHPGIQGYGYHNNICNNTVLSCSTGIDLSGEHNLIDGNILKYNSYYGITFIEGDKNIIKNNDISNNRDGLQLMGCMENNISNNIIANNDDEGVVFDNYYWDSENNIFWNNTFINNKGNEIDEKNNFIIDNSFYNDGILIHPECIVQYNSVNDKPLIMLVNESNKVIENESGMILLHNCNRITIKNQDISNTVNGIYLINSYDCLIHNNSISSNKMNGILLDESDNNDISFNNIESNTMGVYLEYSSYNEIKFNNFKDNNRDGSFHKQADNDWDSNYWDSLNFFIKLILGRVGIIFWFIPWFNIDWMPAREPYDIEV